MDPVHEPLSRRERWIVLTGVFAIWGIIAIGVVAFVSLGMADRLTPAKLRQPLDDPAGWVVETTGHDGHVSERPATVLDMAEDRYEPVLIAALTLVWTAVSAVTFARACRGRRTALTRWVLRAMHS
jgi:hypothetical protein